MATEDLHAVVGDLEREIAREAVRARGLRQRADAVRLVDLPRGLPREPARAFHVHRGVGELEGDALVLSDGAPERAAIARIFHGVVARGARHTERGSSLANE